MNNEDTRGREGSRKMGKEERRKEINVLVMNNE